MNLSNEKNSLLNSVSRVAIDGGASRTVRYVSRGAMAAAALTVATFVIMEPGPAIAACSPASGASASVTCTTSAAGSYVAGTGVSNEQILVIGVSEQGVAGNVATKRGIDLAGGTSNDNTILIAESVGVAVNPLVASPDTDAIAILGDGNIVYNGGANGKGEIDPNIGGGKISAGNNGGDMGIQINGNNNQVFNQSNTTSTSTAKTDGSGYIVATDAGVEANGTGNTINNGSATNGAVGVIEGGNYGYHAGIRVTGGTVGSQNTINNNGGLITGNNSGVNAQDYATINNSETGTIEGTGSGDGIIAGGSDTVTIANEGMVKGAGNGVKVDDGSGTTVTITGTDGTVHGDNNGVNLNNGNTLNVNGGTVEGNNNGINAGSNNTINVNNATVNGDADTTGGGDGIHAGSSNTIKVTNNASVSGDPGIIAADSNLITVDGGSSVNANPEDGINVDDNNTIIIGTATNIATPGVSGGGTASTSGAGTVNATGGGDGISLTDGIDAGGNANGNLVVIGENGTVNSEGNGIRVNFSGNSGSNNQIIVQNGGVVNGGTDGSGNGIVVNGDDTGADNNTVLIESGGTVNAGATSGDGVRLEGDTFITTGLGAATAGGGFGGGVGVDNDLTNHGTIRAAGGNGVLVSNTLSDVDNSGGQIYAGKDGVRFTTIHTDAADGDTPPFGETESGYKSDSNSLIVAGRDGIHYDNAVDDSASADYKAGGGDVNGLGKIDENYFFFSIKGDYPEVVTNDGTIEAQRHGISVNNNFDVTNSGTIVAGGLPGNGGSGGDGISAGANNTITNTGTIASGLDANGDTNGIQLNGGSNTVVNGVGGVIDTRGDTTIDKIDNTTHEAGTDSAADNGAAGDGIHASTDGLDKTGYLNDGKQQSIKNDGTIYAADDGIDVQSGFGAVGGEQLITNSATGAIHANDDGIVAKNYNIIDNAGSISADEDNSGGGDGIHVGHSNTITNEATGTITSGSGNGVVMAGDTGAPFVFGNFLDNFGSIAAGEDGVQINGNGNTVVNEVDATIKGDVNGVVINNAIENNITNNGNIEGGSGAGLNINGGSNNVFNGTTGTITSQVGSGGDGVLLTSTSNNTIHAGSIQGDANGVAMSGSTSNTLSATTITGTNGDGVNITGGSGNVITATGAISGDPGVHLVNTSNNQVSGASITGTNGGVIISNGSNNTVSSTSGVIAGGSGDGVGISGSNNTVTSATDITSTGGDGVDITSGSNNTITAVNVSGAGGIGANLGSGNTLNVSGYITGGDGDGVHLGSGSHVYGATTITGYWDGAEIVGSNSTVAASGAITGENGEGVQIEGASNTVSSGSVVAAQDGVQISGSSNHVSTGSITSSGGSGINVESGSSNTIDATSVTGTGGSGAILGDGNTLNAAGAITGGDGDGVHLGNGSHVYGATTITGYWDGAQIVGSNSSVSASGTITGQHGEGVQIEGSSNTVGSGGVTSVQDGVQIKGSSNTVNTAAINSSGGDGIDIESGSSNTITATSVTGTGGSGANLGASNTLNAAGAITGGAGDGVNLTGGSHVNGATTITGSDDGADISGSGNSVSASGLIKGTGDDGVSISGTSNTVTGGSVQGEDDGVAIVGGGNTVSATAGGITGITGDGVDISGGDGNTVTATGVISGDPGVVITNSNGNTVSGSSISAKNGGVVVSGNSNTISTTSGAIDGNTDNDTTGIGVSLSGNSNTVTSAGAITGQGGVSITGTSNGVSSTSIDGTKGTGTGDGVHIAGGSNTVTTGAISGAGDGIEIASGSSNTITAVGVHGYGGAGALLGSGNTLHAGGAITGDSGVGAKLDGDSHVDGATSITGSTIGADVNGGSNTVTASGTITGNGGIGVDVDGNSNTIGAGGISGSTGGLTLDGLTNNVTVGANGVYGGTLDGIGITGTGNVVTSGGSVTGGNDGVHISGGTNSVSVTGTITGDTNNNNNGVGDGVDISGGDGNNVTATGAITGDPGVIITNSNNNTVSGASISGTNGGVIVTGNGNTISTTSGNIEGNTDEDTTGVGVSLNGTGNTVSAVGEIGGQGGVIISGGGNTVSSALINGTYGTGTGDGVNISGSTNTVTTGAISGDGDGIQIVSGTGNIITATSVTGLGGAGAIMGAGNTLHAGGAIHGYNGDGVNLSGGSTVDGATTITGSADGADLSGDGNHVTASGSIIGQSGDGVIIDGGSNTVSSNSIQGYWDAVHIDGSSNVVTSSGDILGQHAEGVQIAGDSNHVSAAGAIYADQVSGSNDAGVTITGNSNTVSAANVIRSSGGDGVAISGNSNTVSSTNNNFEGLGGDGLSIDGNSNTASAAGAVGYWDGVDINSGTHNNVTIGANGITGLHGQGVDISSDSNEVTSADNIVGATDGVRIGTTGAPASHNTVTATNDITGADGAGVGITGTDNHVTAHDDIQGTSVGIGIVGDSNHVTADDDLSATDGDGVNLDGNGNVIVVGDRISADGDGVNITGNQNNVTFDNIHDTSGDGVQINGDLNDVNVGSAIEVDGNGVWFDSGTGNNVDLRGVTIDAGLDGILVDNAGNTFQHDSATHVIAGENGIEYGYGGTTNAPEALVWYGTIDAAGNGIQTGGDWFSITNHGTINADTDTDQAGTGIVLSSNNYVKNAGDGLITGWNGITGQDYNTIINDGTIDVVNDGIVLHDHNYVENNSNLTIESGDDGIVVNDNNEVVNNGVIHADTDSSGAGTGIVANDHNEISNTGTITGWNGVSIHDSNKLTNDGSIDANNFGVLVTADNNTIDNTNTINGDHAGVRVVYGEDNTITNDDTISGGDEGVQLDNSSNNHIVNNDTITSDGEGINIENNSSDNTVDNYGTVESTGENGEGIEIESNSNGNTVNNYAGATITGWEGVEFEDDATGNTLNNWGTISGAYAIDFEESADSNYVNNYATVTGTYDAVYIDDSYYTEIYNSGSMTGGDYGVEAYYADGTILTNDSTGTISGTGEDGVSFVNSDDVTINNYGSITGGIDGVYLQGENNTVNNYAVDTIQGYSGNGVTIVGDDNTVYNTGAIAGYDEGVAIDGDGNTVDNHDVYATITGQHGDGIDINSGTNNSITNWGTITGHWQGVDNSSGNLTINQYAGTITGQNSDGVRSNTGEDAGLYDTTINNYSVNYGEDGIVGGEIVGATNGVAVGGFDFTLLSGTNSNIQGLDGDGIVTWALTNDIENYGTIQGTEIGIHDYGVTNGGDYDGTTIYNGSTGTITGTRAGYLYEPAGDVQTSASYTDYPSDHTVEIYNYGTISVTGDGTLPDGYNNPPANTEQGTQVSGAVDTTLITGENAAPVAAIDTSRGDASLETYVYNWGVIQGANEFQTPTTGEDGGNTDQSSTVAQADGTIQLTNRFAILGGAGSEYVANFAGGTINGDVALQGNDDSFAMEIGSTFNGNLDMGQTLTDGFVLGPIPDDPATKDVDESKGGTAYGWVASKDQIDTGVDLVTLFGAGGTQNYNGDITEAEVLYVDDRVTESDIINGLSADAVPYPPLPNQPTPDGTWNLNGNVSVDGTHLWKTFAYDSNGDGVADAESDPQVIGTVGTIVNNGRLNIGGTEAVQVQVPVDANKDGVQDTDPDSGDPLFTTETQYVTHTEATLTTPVVDVWSGGTLGGHGTIVTDPGADGGNGGVNLTGKVQGDTEYQVGSQSPTYTVYTPSEARGSLITGTAAGDLVTQGEDGTVTDATKGDGVNDFTLDTSGDTPVKTDIQYTVDSAGKYYPDITLPEGFKSENFDGAFDFTTDSPRYATIAPGDEVNRIGTLTIYGNVNFDSMQTATTTYTVAVADDPATKDVDESKGGTATKDIEGRTVVTNWGSQFQADLKADGAGDQLLVKKTGTTTAITSDTVDTTGPGPVDKVTQDSDGNITDSTKGDGVNDFTVTGTGADAVKTDILEPGKGGPDGVPDGVIYKVSDVSDGHVHLAGRLDIRLDGQFVDEVNNSEPATLPNPDTGCNDAPDGTPNCDPIKNDAHYVPDGIADVNADGIATPTADFTKHATVWDVIVAEGGIDGKFDEKGFDGGANDGAVVTRYPGVTVDDPSTPDVNEGGQPITEVRVQLLKAYLEYLPDRVRIISIPNFANLADSPNQVAIGEYLDTLSQYGLNEDELSGILASLGLTGDIPAGLDALSPEWYNAFNEVGISIAHGAEEQAYVRTIEAQGFSSGQTNRVVMHVGDHSAVGSSANDKRASFWLSAQYGNSHVDSNKGFLEYKYDTVSGYAGFDYLVTPNVLLGILGGFGHSSVDSKNGYDSGKVNNWQIGGYASAFANNWFVNAGGGYGHMSIKSTRDIQFGSDLAMQISEVAQADYNGNLTYLYGKAGYGLDLGNSGWKLSPELGLSYVKVKQDAFTETNAGLLNLAVDRQSVDSLRGTAQLRLSKTFWNGNGGGWMPYVRFGVADEFKDNLRPISANFASSGGSFTIYGDAPRGGASAIFGAGVTGKVSEMFSLYLDYSGEIGSDFKEHIISGGARIHF